MIYGKIHFDLDQNEWIISEIHPMAREMLKRVFKGLYEQQRKNFRFKDNLNNCHLLDWFIKGFELTISNEDKMILARRVEVKEENEKRLSKILDEKYEPSEIKLNKGITLRDYQAQLVDLFNSNGGNLLSGDELGLGKTFEAMGVLICKENLPAVVCVKPHLFNQWKRALESNTNLNIIGLDKLQVSEKPLADVYLTKYNCLETWKEFIVDREVQTIIYDEVHELRRRESTKYKAAEFLSKNISKCLGLSATPIFNYGDEAYNVINIVKRNFLGSREMFLREWTTHTGNNKIIVSQPDVLGRHLADNFVYIKRTRADVGLSETPVFQSVQKVKYNKEIAQSQEAVLKQLANTVLHGNYIESGQAALKLDVKMREITGLAKAPYVAEYAKLFLNNNEPIILCGWHHNVYKKWGEYLKEFNPLFYHGKVNTKQKDENIQKFLNGESNLLIMSLRSGEGLNDLEKRCNNMLFGELDFSPSVHKQIKGRITARGIEDKLDPINAIFVVTDYGSDPIIQDILAIKSSQSDSIFDKPFNVKSNIQMNDSRIKELAKSLLD